MHVIVLGAGVIGMTTAYYLADRGCEVTVIDRSEEVGSGASHANGGQLSYSFTDALANPGFLASIPWLIAGMDSGSKIRISPQLVTWGTRFLGQCTSRRAVGNTLSVLELALRSAQLLADLRKRTSFDFSFRPAGKIVLLADDRELRAAVESTQLKQLHGCEARIISPQEVADIEPTLDGIAESFIAAVYSRSDEVADARRFVLGLREHLEQSGRVRLQLATDVDNLITANNRITGVDCAGPIDGDAVVVCLGAWSGRLLRTVGVNPHLYPMRGYSITLPPGSRAPDVSISSIKHRIVFSRLGNSMRIAGFSDFRGFNTGDDQRRIKTLTETARGFAPQAAQYDTEDVSPWGGFRPMTPSGRPCIGATRRDGLFVNTGHGMLGWTLACATGHDVAVAVTGGH
jgi:D-amino-acid dehydrogenase